MLCVYLELRCSQGRELHPFSGRRVLELGSGPGLAGTLVAHLGGDATLTDMDSVVAMTRHNAELNPIPPSCPGSLSVRELRWGVDVREAGWGAFDLIIGSELIYRDELHGLLLVTLLQLATPATEVLLAHARRGQGQFDRWRRRFGRYFEVQEVATEEETQGYVDRGFVWAADEPVSIWRLRFLGPPVFDEDLTKLFACMRSKDPCEWLSVLALSEMDLETIEACDLDEGVTPYAE